MSTTRLTLHESLRARVAARGIVQVTRDVACSATIAGITWSVPCMLIIVLASLGGARQLNISLLPLAWSSVFLMCALLRILCEFAGRDVIIGTSRGEPAIIVVDYTLKRHVCPASSVKRIQVDNSEGPYTTLRFELCDGSRTTELCLTTRIDQHVLSTLADELGLCGIVCCFSGRFDQPTGGR
jgi:hypothetical protein